MSLTTDEILGAAWRALAENPNMDKGFPRGFWPDLARVGVEMALQGTLEPMLDFRPTRSGDVTVSHRRGVAQGLPLRVKQAVRDTENENPFLRHG